MTQDPLLVHRARFPITQRSNYLISNSLGAMPAAARASVTRVLDQWESRGVRSWGDGWWVMQEQVGDVIAGLLGATKGSVSMHQNIAVAQEMILSCFRFDGRRNQLVYADRNFPSDQYIHEARAALGARLVRVPAASDGISTDGERVAAAIGDETLLVCIDHVMFRSSAIVDLEPIVAKARKHGAFVVLDVFHSAGIVPLDVQKLGVHAIVGGALKWLCGGRSPAAGVHRLGRAQEPVRVLARRPGLPHRRRPLLHRHAERAGAGVGQGRHRDRRRGRRRRDPREEPPSDRAAGRSGAARRPRDPFAARRRAARRPRRARRAARLRGVPGTGSA
jgi:kynureninase